MKKIICFAALLLYASNTAFSQDNKEVTYIQIDYHKVDADKIADYIQAEQAWKKVHESAKKGGKTLRWMLYEVLLPNGTAVEHNYLTVKIYKDYASLETIVPDLAAEFAKVYPNKNFAEFYMSTDKTRNRVRTEIFANIDGYWNPNAFFQHKYARMDYFKTDVQNPAPFVDAEKNLWKPAHKVSVENGKLNGWQLCSKLYTSNTDDYSHLAVSFFTDFAQTNTSLSNFEASLKKAHPNLTEKEIVEKIMVSIKQREFRYTELVKLIDSI